MPPGTRPDPANRKGGFPFYKSRKKFEDACRKGVVKRGAKARMKVIEALEPCKGGNKQLWRLHELDIVDKHQVLLPVFMSLGSTSIEVFVDDWSKAGHWTTIAPPTYPIEEGTEVFRIVWASGLPTGDVAGL